MTEFQHRAIYPGAELFLIRNFMRESGIDEHKWLFGTGLTPDSLTNQDLKASATQFDMIYRNIYRLDTRADRGLRLGLALDLSRWGMLAMALLSAKSLGAALQTANDFRALLRSRFNLIPQFLNTDVRIDIEPRSDQNYPVHATFAHEILLGTLMTQIRNLLASKVNFDRVDIAYPAPPHAASYTELLNCPVRFSCQKTAIYMPGSLLAKALPLANPVAQKQALEICKNEIRTLERLAQNDIRTVVSQALANSRDSKISLEDVAKKLLISPRTLRRKLQHSDTSFREIQQQHMLERALQALSESEHTIDAIAHQCGFRDSSGFRAAFKRWTGMTPRDYRNHFISSDD